MKSKDITPGMVVWIRRQSNKAVCDEYRIIERAGWGQWLVERTDTKAREIRDGRAFRKQ